VRHRQKGPKRLVVPDVLPTHKEVSPRYLGAPNIEDGHLAWRFSKADTNGPYSCGTFSHADFKMLWDKLRSFEQMNIAQLRAAKSYHPLAVVNASKSAKERLQHLQLDDVETLYSFHISNTCRLWCMRFINILSILWWDKKHDVYPVDKKGT
jgi:hypothetical protein